MDVCEEVDEKRLTWRDATYVVALERIATAKGTPTLAVVVVRHSVTIRLVSLGEESFAGCPQGDRAKKLQRPRPTSVRNSRVETDETGVGGREPSSYHQLKDHHFMPI